MLRPSEAAREAIDAWSRVIGPAGAGTRREGGAMSLGAFWTDQHERVAQAAVEVVASINRGESPIVAIGQTFDEVYDGDVLYEVTDGPFVGWQVTIYADAGCWDWVAGAREPSGASVSVRDFDWKSYAFDRWSALFDQFEDPSGEVEDR